MEESGRILRIRDLLYDRNSRLKYPSQEAFSQLKEIVRSDIIKSVRDSLAAGNITLADALEMTALANTLYEQIILHYQKRRGG